MFEVNFFEKKQRNLLPYLIGAGFLLLLILTGAYFFSMQAYYTRTETRNQEWLQTEKEQLLVSKQMQDYERLTEQAAENKAAFEALQYPMAYVMDAVTRQIPNREQQLTVFNKNETDQLTLVLDGLTVTEISETVEKFRGLPYVTEVHVIRLENQVDGAGATVELWLDLDEAALREEVQS